MSDDRVTLELVPDEGCCDGCIFDVEDHGACSCSKHNDVPDCGNRVWKVGTPDPEPEGNLLKTLEAIGDQHG